ncbi:unnamed protein product [Rotaria sordida]|uniref:PLAT domain-containing protein n=1 Tax=Rotaria sordida TaxID=392033 RepID=A0A818Q448_9BILA|nr:unnamed protein product [Rotaria sordida]
MTHLDSSTLATYNSLADPHLQCYFSNERIRSHLRHAGLISRRGEIVPDSEYRLKLARRDHKKHVRQMLAENIVHRAIDMERARQAELKRQLDMASKAALVHSVKESRRRGGYSSGNMANSTDMGVLSIHSSWSQSRPKSANHHREIDIANEEFGDVPRVSRVQSAHVSGDHRKKYSSKSPIRHRHHQHLNRPKSSSVSRSLPLKQRSHALTKPSDSSLSIPPCRITMVYYGPHTKLEYDHSLFEPVDEIIVMQQHCGGENLIVYKDHLKPGDEFKFNSRRHSDYPFGLSLYVKGLIDSRISTCCEYKHRHGVRLGGERGHFAILSVEGSKPCIKCRFEKQTRFKQSADSPKDLNETDDRKKKPITISIPVSDQTKTRHTPVKIPVKHTPISNEDYAEDFDGSDDAGTSKNDYSSESNEHKRKTGATATDNRSSAAAATVPLKTPTETSSTSTVTSEESLTKTWQIIFHTSNSPSGSFQLPKNTSINAFLKFSFISINGKDETEQYKIEMKDFPQYFKSGRQDSFRTKLRDIGKPKQIRLILEITGNDDDDDDDDDDIKWQLDHIELIDPKTQSHYKFLCNQWIRPFQEKILNVSEPSQDNINRRSSTSTTSSKSSSSSSSRKKLSPLPPPPPPTTTTTNAQKAKTSSRSSSSSSSSLSSSYERPQRFELIEKPTINQTRRISTDNESTNEKNKIHYRISIFPSKDDDGEFFPSNDSQIFIRLNNQTKNSFILEKNTKNCPSFESGENQSFDIDLIQNINEQPTHLTIGYYNSNITAGKWKLDKIVLINKETDQETIFPCKNSLIRNDFDLRAEQTFQAESKQSDDDDDGQSTPRNIDTGKRASSRSESDENIQQKQAPLTTKNENLSSSSESLQLVTTKPKNDEKSPSIHSSASSTDDEDNEYNRMFDKQNSNNKSELDSSLSRPKTRRGLQNTIENDNKQNNTSNELQTNTNIWRPSSELDRKEPVDPLIGLDDLQDQTSRSNDKKTQNSVPPTTDNHTESPFKNWYTRNTDDDDDDDDDNNNKD